MCLARLDETGGIVVDSSTQHPAETQEIVARGAGDCASSGHGAVPADGRRIRREGDAGQSLGGDCGSWGVEDGRPVCVRLPRHLDMALTGKRHPFLARFHVGFERRRAYSGTRVVAVFGWRLESRSFRAGHVARTVPLRQRVSDTGAGCARLGLQDAQDIADGISRIRRTAGHDRDRGHSRSHCAHARPAAACGSRAEFLSRRRCHALRPAGEGCRHECSGSGTN